MTNVGKIEPLGIAKRYNRKEKKTVNVQQPNVIQDYNKNMGGVDLHDNGIANYRIRVKGKKWWWPLFTNAVDSAVVNSWKFYNLVNGEKVSQFDYRSKLVLSLVKSEENKNEETINDAVDSISNRNLGRPSKNALPRSIKMDDIGHLIIRKQIRRRCRNCQSQTIYLCKKCNVFLHPDCFEEFHKK